VRKSGIELDIDFMIGEIWWKLERLEFEPDSHSRQGIARLVARLTGLRPIDRIGFAFTNDSTYHAQLFSIYSERFISQWVAKPG
jgi:hypothetical protein